MSANVEYWPTKHSSGVEKYGFDLTQELESGETVSSVSWTVPSGITGSTETESTEAVYKVFSGGTDGQMYEITAVITTSEARDIPKVARLVVRDDA